MVARQEGGNKPPAYEAYKTSDRTERLSIRRHGHLTYKVAYRHLLYLTHDEEENYLINLIYGFMTIEIQGRNLKPVLDALADDRCDFIRDFDPKAYPPLASDQPIIESIKITPARNNLGNEERRR